MNDRERIILPLSLGRLNIVHIKPNATSGIPALRNCVYTAAMQTAEATSLLQQQLIKEWLFILKDYCTQYEPTRGHSFSLYRSF